MEEGNAEITPVDKEVLSTWLANNHEEYAEFKELCHALATETDITKISKTFDVDIESLINLLTVFMCLQEENVTINPHCSSPCRHMLNNVSKPASDWRNMRFLPDF